MGEPWNPPSYLTKINVQYAGVKKAG
jgi:hypothetical protein